MLPPQHRLQWRGDFAQVYQRGNCWHSQFFVLWSAWRADFHQGLDEKNSFRIGIVTGQKVSKSAVKRNLVKRRIRQACQALTGEIMPGWDLIFIARRSALELQTPQFLPELKQLLAKAGILNGY